MDRSTSTNTTRASGHRWSSSFHTYQSALGLSRLCLRLDEPGVLVAGVVDDQVGDDPDAPGVGLVEQPPEVVDGAALGMHRVEVADVVAAVAEGRRVEREQPEAVDPQPLEVVELGDEPGDVPDAVVVAVEEPPDEDLVEDGPLEPERILLGRRPRLTVDPQPSGSAPSGASGIGPLESPGLESTVTTARYLSALGTERASSSVGGRARRRAGAMAGQQPVDRLVGVEVAGRPWPR